MIAGGDAINTRLVKIVAYLRRHAKSMCGVFRVHDDGVDFIVTADIGQLLCHGVARIASYDIAQKKYSHPAVFPLLSAR